MPHPRLMRRGLALAAVLAALAVAWFGMPRLLARMAFFRVQRVEFVGLRYHDPAMLLEAMALPAGSSVFGRHDSAEARLLEVPGVVSARVGRRLPGTLRVELVERPPVALAPSGGRLMTIDAQGQVLPYDPMDGAPDLPVVRSADSVVAAGLARIRELDPEAWAAVAAAERAGGDLLLTVGAHRWRLPAEVSAEALRAVQVVADELAREGRRYRELDGRFARQVVVRGLTL